MASFKRFEEIEAWQRARLLTNQIYDIAPTPPLSRDFGLVDQMRRASNSIMANIAEGFGRRTNKEFSNFLVIAHGSAAEVQSHLYLAFERKYISEAVFSELYGNCDEVSRMLMSLCRYLRNNI
ncbi:four helix bundle protein [soil metagenome]